VLAHVLLSLRDRRGGAAVCAVHIDYANRAESAAEAAFLQRWCDARGVRLHIRRVAEVSRGSTPRDEYERESRRIRFDAYKQAMAEFGAKAVFFGHHLGDVQENVVSNVFRGTSVLDIGGIEPISINSGVAIWRPMLPHVKDEILDYAHKYGVPYFKDTTPAWSTRGRLRNELLPLIQQVYGDGYRAHLNTLARDSTLCSDLLESQLFGPFRESVLSSTVAVWFDAAARAQLPLFFWREALREVCERRLGIGLVKEKAVLVFLERLRTQRRAARGSWLALKKESRVLLTQEGLLVFFRPGVFNGHHEGRIWVPKAHAEEGELLSASGLQGTCARNSEGRDGASAPPSSLPSADDAPEALWRFGPWTVGLCAEDSRVGAKTPNGEGCGASVTLLDLLRGEFRYKLPRHCSYQVGPTSRAVVPALRELSREWQGIIIAIPQVVGYGEPMQGEVTVTFFFSLTAC